MRSRDFSVFLPLVAGACAAPAASPAAREAEPRAIAAADPVVAPPGPSVPPQPAVTAEAPPERKLELVLLQATPSPNPPAVVEIKFPILGQLIPSAKASGFKVRLKVENWPLAARGSGVEIALDQAAPRRVLGVDGVPLGSLGSDLTPGGHLLVAWAVRETGEVVRPPPGASRAPFAAVRFSIGEDKGSKPPSDAPVLRLVSPVGTINGERAADTLVVDCLVLFAEFSALLPLHVKIQGDGAGAPPLGAELAQPVWAPVGVRGLSNGDWKITLEHGASRVTRVVTVNRDLAPALVP